MDDCNCNLPTCDCCVNKPTTVETETTTLVTPAYFNDKSVSLLTNDELLATQNVVLDDVAATLALFNKNILNNTVFDKTEYTFVVDRLAEGAITQTEYREFLNEYDYTVDTATTTGTATTNILNNPKKHMEHFNNFLKATIAGVAVSSLCKFLSDPFNKITSAISLFSDFLGGFKSLKDLLASLENPLDALSGLAATLKAFATSLIDSVADIVNSIKDKVLNIVSKINEKISNIVGMQGSVMANLKSWFSKQFATIQNALSEGNIANLITNISTKIAEAVLGFAELTLEAIEFLLFLFCKLATSVENNLISLLDPLHIAANSISPVIQSLAIGSAHNTLRSVIAGRPVPEPGTLAAMCQEYTDRVNTQATDQAANSDNTTSGANIYPSSYHSTHPDPKTGWSNLSFKEAVLYNPFFLKEYDKKWDGWPMMPTYGDDVYEKKSGIWKYAIITGYVNIVELGISPADGYYGMELGVLEKMNEVGKRMGLKLHVLSARRHQHYNDYIRYIRGGYRPGVAKTSQHRHGKALDIAAYGNIGDDEANLKFLQLCQKVGFVGFGYYPGNDDRFLHCDVASARDWPQKYRPEGWAPYPIKK